MSVPKVLADPAARKARHALLEEPHIAPLTAFVHGLRAEKGPDHAIPYFDPLDGGVHASVLFLLEAPGPRAVASGFISRNNPDETAKNFHELNVVAGIERRSTVTWNVVPWYIGSGVKIRSAKRSDIEPALASLWRLLDLLPKLRVIVLVGRKAGFVQSSIRNARPSAHVFEIPHPSPMFVNRKPVNRELLLAALQQVAVAANAQ